jgi:hypothetical protein
MKIMKKILLILGISIMLLTPVVLSENIKLIENTTEENINCNVRNTRYMDPPGWANGRFNGTWGLNILGVPAVELGWVYGYFDAIGIFGRLEGYFAEWKDEEPVSFITGFIILYNMIGYVGSIENSSNGTFFSGLGAPNENGEFYYRINLFIGTSWYMEGTWEEIE